MNAWQDAIAPLRENKIGVYVVRGNHEDDANNNITVWNSVFSDSCAMPQNGPAGEVNLTYSLTYNNAMFVGLDDYISIHRVNQSWLNEQIATNTHPHLFVFGHESAFKCFHADNLGTDSTSSDRNTFWESIKNAGAKIYFCGHDHFFDLMRVDDGDLDPENDLYQAVVGTGGGWLMSQYRYNGNNAPYNPVSVYHEMQFGYMLVEVSGETDDDRGVKLVWKEALYDSLESTYKISATEDTITYEVAEKVSVKKLKNRSKEVLPVYNELNRTISFTTTEAGECSLDAYSLSGRKCVHQIKRCSQAGHHVIHLLNSQVQSGIYTVVLKNKPAVPANPTIWHMLLSIY